MNKKREITEIILGFFGALISLYGLVMFNRHILAMLPLTIRMAAMIITYWAVAVIPVIIIAVSRDKMLYSVFSKEKLIWQILVGVLIGVAFSAVLTLLPHLLGLGTYVDNGRRYTQFWQFVYEFIYCICAVGLVEEFLFRGFFYEKLRRVGNQTVAMIVSSLLFGLFHLFNGNIVQMILTSLLGIVWCLCRNKIKNCSLLSLIIAHGIYDALITVFSSLLLQ